MKFCLIVLACLLALAHSVPLHQVEDIESRIPGTYIVKYNENLTDSDIAFYLTKIVSQDNIVIKDTFDIGVTFRGFIADLSSEQLNNRLQEDSFLEYIQEDSKVSVGYTQETEQSCPTQSNAIWNLKRIGVKVYTNAVTNYYYQANSNNQDDVICYVIDTGIYLANNEFGGRAIWGWTYPGGTTTDCNGHGTHVAGTICGTLYGVCKNCRTVAVKVLDCNGSGSNTNVVAGINWAVNDCIAKKKKCTANMSLGGSKNTATDNAVSAGIAAGVTFVVAAGNSNTDACTFSPAAVPTAVSVGATQLSGTGPTEKPTDLRSSFSNYGRCVSIFAPGSTITAAWIGSPSATNTISGTSMASPHVCGVATRLLASNNYTPAQLKKHLIDFAVVGAINLNCANTVCSASPNLFLNNQCA